MFLAILDTSIKYFNIKAKHFQHFHYVINLAKDCELRLEKVIKSENRKKCVSDKDVMIKIGIVGDLTDDNLNLLSKGKGRVRLHFLHILSILILLRCLNKIFVIRREKYARWEA